MSDTIPFLFWARDGSHPGPWVSDEEMIPHKAGDVAAWLRPVSKGDWYSYAHCWWHDPSGVVEQGTSKIPFEAAHLAMSWWRSMYPSYMDGRQDSDGLELADFRFVLPGYVLTSASCSLGTCRWRSTSR